MAVTKIWDVKGSAKVLVDYVSNPEKTVQYLSEEKLTDLEEVINYADDVRKTEEHFYTTALNCSKKNAAKDFNRIKEEFGKTGGIVCYHAYQSFDKGEGTPEQVHEIGVKLAKELWGDRFQVVVATHLNTDCLHNHFVINSVSFVDGKKYYDTKETYKKFREASDRLCEEYGLSVIKDPKGKRTPMYLYKLEKSGAPTRYNVARAIIDEAVSLSITMEEFKAELRKMGCSYRFDRKYKYWTITPPGWQKPIRIYRLGAEYSNERIVERVESNDKSVRQRRYELQAKKPNRYHMKKRVHRIMGRSGLEKLYLRYCYELGYLPKYTQNPKRMHYLLKEDLLKCELYSKEAKLLAINHIVSRSDLKSYKESVEGKMASLMSERDEERKVAKRLIPEEERERRKGRIKELTKEIKELRSEVKLILDIEERSEIVLKKMNYLENEERNMEVRSR